MIEFDKGLRTAVIKLSLNGVYLNLNLSLGDIRSEALLQDSRLGELGPKRLKALLEYVDHRFEVDPRSPIPWKEQFCRALAKECDALLSLPVKLTPEQLREVRRAVRETNVSLERAAQAAPGALGLALEFQYHDGFNHLTRDDDFIAVRRGGRIVGVIALPGNDYNEVKKFLMAGGDRVLDPTNVECFRAALRHARKMDALRLTGRVSRRVVSAGIKIGG